MSRCPQSMLEVSPGKGGTARQMKRDPAMTSLQKRNPLRLDDSRVEILDQTRAPASRRLGRGARSNHFPRPAETPTTRETGPDSG
jgi:hypothetical protein